MKDLPLKMTADLGVELWVDTCAPVELKNAVSQGARGATSNPVIALTAIKSDPQKWTPVLDELIQRYPTETEDELTWRLIAVMGQESAQILKDRGLLCLQVNPKYYLNSKLMVDHALNLNALAPNLAIKLPCTEAGLEAIEELTAQGVVINSTVSFTVSQAMAAAEAVERGLKRAQSKFKNKSGPYITLMVGRLDDLLGRVAIQERLSIEPGVLQWAGIAVAKKTHRLFLDKKYKSKLLIAAYRHNRHWLELVGSEIIQSIPFNWWKEFQTSQFLPKESLSKSVEPKVLELLLENFTDFRKAYEEGGLKPNEFTSFGASKHTIAQFLGGYQELVELVRARRLV